MHETSPPRKNAWAFPAVLRTGHHRYCNSRYVPMGRVHKEPVDVAIYLPSLGEGGIERVYLNLAQEFVRRGLRVDLLVAQARGARQSDVPAGARVVDFGARRRGTLWLAPGFVRHLRSTCPRVVLSSSGLNLLAVWARLVRPSGPRVVVTVHNTLSKQFATLGRRHRAIIPPLLATFLPKVDALGFGAFLGETAHQSEGIRAQGPLGVAG